MLLIPSVKHTNNHCILNISRWQVHIMNNNSEYLMLTVSVTLLSALPILLFLTTTLCLFFYGWGNKTRDMIITCPSHKANKCYSWDSNAGSLVPASMLLTSLHNATMSVCWPPWRYPFKTLPINQVICSKIYLSHLYLLL